MNATAQRTEAAILLAASEVKGARVINFQNENIGDVDELLIEPDTGQVRFAVLSVGGFLGLGSTKVAVPWLAFQIVSERGKIKYMMLDATRERLEKAPRVEGKNYERLYPPMLPNLSLSIGTWSGRRSGKAARVVRQWKKAAIRRTCAEHQIVAVLPHDACD